MLAKKAEEFADGQNWQVSGQKKLRNLGVAVFESCF